jgi:hypothetical protein
VTSPKEKKKYNVVFSVSYTVTALTEDEAEMQAAQKADADYGFVFTTSAAAIVEEKTE